jgi:beta-xylosidase
VLALVIAVLVAASTGLTMAPTSARPLFSTSPTYTNPVIPLDFPDPFVLNDGGTFVAYATNANGPNIQVMSSVDLRTWAFHRDALPSLPAWAVPGKTWAPSVLRTGAGRYVLFFTAQHRTGGVPCIGSAAGPTAYGPFSPISKDPIVCQPSRGGSIDPSPFTDAFGRPWLLWKSEGIAGSEPTRLWSRPMTLDARTFAGPAHHLARQDLGWEGDIIENPSMIRARGAHFLFYSAGRWQDASYGIGFAICDGPGGPCRKAPHKWVGSTSAVAGPGGQEIFRGADGSLWMSYHAWDARRVGYAAGGRRSLRVDRIWFGHADGNPRLLGPSTGPVQY